MNKEFQVHMLNDTGKKKAARIAKAFDRLLTELTMPLESGDGPPICPTGRELAITKTKLEEACFFAKKAMASAPENTQESWAMQTEPKKFRKKPVVIEAFQTEVEQTIETLEGPLKASPGDWIITGVKGEKYPCKPDIFAATYEPA